MRCRTRFFRGDLLAFLQVELARSQDRQLGDLIEVPFPRDPEVGEALGIELLPNFRDFEADVEDDEAFALAFVGDGGDDADPLGGAGDGLDFVLDLLDAAPSRRRSC